MGFHLLLHIRRVESVHTQSVVFVGYFVTSGLVNSYDVLSLSIFIMGVKEQISSEVSVFQTVEKEELELTLVS